MKDIVERLRSRSDALDAYHNIEEMRVMTQAADEIERLRSELKWIGDQRWNEDADLDDICTRADRALSTT